MILFFWNASSAIDSAVTSNVQYTECEKKKGLLR